MNKVKVIKLLDNRINETLDYDNPAVLDKHWEDLTEAICDNSTEDEIIDFITSMDDKHLYWASEVFDDIYDKLGESNSFAEKLEKLQQERPNVNLGLF